MPPPPGAELRGVRPADPPPRAFLPLEDGSVLLLEAGAARLTRVRGREVLAEMPLVGAQFDPDETDLVDLALDGRGRILILDALAGSVWVADQEGQVQGRFGLFVAPMRLALGADGAVYVADPGNASVTSFRAGAVRASFPSGLALAPFGTSSGEVPFLRHGRSQQRTQVGLLASRGRQLEARALGMVEPRPGMHILDTRVVGSHGDRLLVAVASAPEPDAAIPAALEVWLMPTRPGDEEPARRFPAPPLVNPCWDCGPDYRVGPDGALWYYALEQDSYRVYRLEVPEARP
jgi:hypothetical protein